MFESLIGLKFIYFNNFEKQNKNLQLLWEYHPLAEWEVCFRVASRPQHRRHPAAELSSASQARTGPPEGSGSEGRRLSHSRSGSPIGAFLEQYTKHFQQFLRSFELNELTFLRFNSSEILLSCVVCCRKLNNKTILCLYIYSDKLVNHLVVNNCLYFCCTIVHREECVSAKMVGLLHDVMSLSYLTTSIAPSRVFIKVDIPFRIK